jgi:PHD/YefM family antitoxin component YafN of YafNO toxin-antitoxin module
MERIISVTDLVRNAARIADEVTAEGTIYRITRGGRGAMVLVDEEYFEGWMAAIDEMRRSDWREVLDQARRDMAEGRGRTLDSVAKEIERDHPALTTRRGPAPGATKTRGKQGTRRAPAPRARAAKRSRVPR